MRPHFAQAHELSSPRQRHHPQAYELSSYHPSPSLCWLARCHLITLRSHLTQHRRTIFSREWLSATHTLHAAILLLLLPIYLLAILSMRQVCYYCYRCYTSCSAVTYTLLVWVIYYKYDSSWRLKIHIKGHCFSCIIFPLSIPPTNKV